MTFTARPQLRVLILVFFLAILFSFMSFIPLFFMLFIVISGFIRYELSINDCSIAYNITLFNKLIK